MPAPRVLLTGLSGAGKSTITRALTDRGHHAVDLDCDAYSAWVAVADAPELAAAPGTPVDEERDWVWRPDRVGALLAPSPSAPLFVSGCSANMGQFLPYFDHIVLLTAPPSALLQRLAARTGDAYGARAEERARVLDLVRTVEPRLRRIAGHIIDTRAALPAVLDRLEALVAGHP